MFFIFTLLGYVFAILMNLSGTLVFVYFAKQKINLKINFAGFFHLKFLLVAIVNKWIYYCYLDLTADYHVLY